MPFYNGPLLLQLLLGAGVGFMLKSLCIEAEESFLLIYFSPSAVET